MFYSGNLNTEFEPLTDFEEHYKIKLVDGIPKVKWIVSNKHAKRTSSNGYTRINLYNKEYYLHRVACKHYIDPSCDNFKIKFIDRNKSNIHMSNLILKTKQDKK